MSYTPSYTRKNFVNGQAPSINATNLNAIEDALVNLENNASTDSSRIDTLNTSINAEKSAREYNDYLINQSIVTETNARQHQDYLLNQSISETNAKAEATQRSLDALWHLEKGATWDRQTVSSDAYTDTVGSGCRIADVQRLGGKSVVWNQLMGNYSCTRNAKGVTCVNTNGHITFSGTSDSIGMGCELAWSNFKLTKGHKIYFKHNINLPSGDYLFEQYSSTSFANMNNKIITLYSNFLIPQLFIANANVSYANVSGDIFVFDLTLMYGSGNEPSTTTDERIKAIESYASTHSAYNSGELISAKVTSVKSKSSDADTIEEVTIPTSLQSIDLHSAGSVYDYFDFVPKKYSNMKSVDLGSFNYTYYNDTFYAEISDKVQGSDVLFCEKYGLCKTTPAWNTPNLCMTSNDLNKFVYFKNSAYTSASAFKSAMSGTILWYESTSGGEDKSFMTLHKRVGVVDLGSASWSTKSLANNRTAFYTKGVVGYKENTHANIGALLPLDVSQVYQSASSWGTNTYLFHPVENILPFDSFAIIYLSDKYASVSEFKSAMNGVFLHYELGAEQVTLIEDDIDYFKCEANGTITYLQESTELPIPHTTEYTVQLTEVGV